MGIEQVLSYAIDNDASDIFIIPGAAVTYKIRGKLQREDAPPMKPEDTRRLVEAVYQICSRSDAAIQAPDGDDDFSFALPRMGRFRANIMHQRGSLAAVLRVIRFGLPSAEQLHISPLALEASNLKHGLVLVTGSAGSGKSTTLACMIDHINHTRSGHIITMEDPIEYVHSHAGCLVTQREIHTDCVSYLSAMRSALRESPDVILLGEMRDHDTIETAITAAETGQLLFSTLHTPSAATTVDRIIDSFPANQQSQVRAQLAMVLRTVISQQLVPSVNGGLVPAFEVMRVNMAIRNLIRENKTHQIDNAIQAGVNEGMCTMESSLVKLCREGEISTDTAMLYAPNYDNMRRKLLTSGVR